MTSCDAPDFKWNDNSTTCLGCSVDLFNALNTTLGLDQIQVFCNDLMVKDVTIAVLESSVLTLQSNVTTLSEGLASTNGNLGGVTEGLNTVYLVLSSALVFIMHGVFAMVSRTSIICAICTRVNLIYSSFAALRWSNPVSGEGRIPSEI